MPAFSAPADFGARPWYGAKSVQWEGVEKKRHYGVFPASVCGEFQGFGARRVPVFRVPVPMMPSQMGTGLLVHVLVLFLLHAEMTTLEGARPGRCEPGQRRRRSSASVEERAIGGSDVATGRAVRRRIGVRGAARPRGPTRVRRSPRPVKSSRTLPAPLTARMAFARSRTPPPGSPPDPTTVNDPPAHQVTERGHARPTDSAPLVSHPAKTRRGATGGGDQRPSSIAGW